jgi:GntR family transcriptional regulator
MFQVDPMSRTPVYEQIVDQTERFILAGIINANDKLPSVRELAATLTINPNTIQRAYRQLEMDGWIATVPGKGCFVCGAPTAALRERDGLLNAFDKTAAALLALGMSREELVDRLLKGGIDHA